MDTYVGGRVLQNTSVLGREMPESARGGGVRTGWMGARCPVAALPVTVLTRVCHGTGFDRRMTGIGIL